MLGAGAIGCLFASALRSTGPVTLLLREATAAAAEVVVERDGGASRVSLPISAAAQDGAISHLLVTTKAYDVRRAVSAVAHRLTPACQILLLGNGMGMADELRADFPHLALYCGTTTAGAYRIAPLHVRHAGRGATRIGQPGRRLAPPWFSRWSRTVADCTWDAQIEQALWLKLAINCAINPLTALHGCRNGELAARPELALQVARLCDEIAAIAGAAGYSGVARQVHGAVADVIAGTAHNRSSMLQDVAAGRRTEIDYISAYLLRVAARCNVPAPANAALLRRIRALTAPRIDPEG